MRLGCRLFFPTNCKIAAFANKAALRRMRRAENREQRADRGHKVYGLQGDSSQRMMLPAWTGLEVCSATSDTPGGNAEASHTNGG